MVGSSKVEYVQSGQLIAATYVKNSKAIGFLWGVFSICYAIITVVVFIQPQWIGTRAPAATGYFGLWRHCAVSTIVTESTTTTEFLCRGRLDDFSSLLNPAFRAATIFIGIATLVSILSVMALVLFVCAPTTIAYHIVAWMQTIAGRSCHVIAYFYDTQSYITP
ncbi:unnamed protein product [Allacma fusca]|uniref:Uncharacterized protein n=1 Tax=Allacma fusca TaxID=39272 RepID=A0A8J2KV91_9HEXA|nr:unnamed protein product [Allacma fusca]